MLRYAFDTINVVYNYKPVFSLGPDKTICNSNTLLLDPGIDNANYTWQDGSSFPTYIVRQSGIYSVNISNQCGSLSDTLAIQKGGCELYIPNSFSPNGNGENDLFRPLTFGNFNFYEFAIFNRYGKIVFQSKDPLKGWDGNYQNKKQDAGTYVWKCIYQIDNMMKNSETGTVILIR
jgi:gliding motility-associated-like protein